MCYTFSGNINIVYNLIKSAGTYNIRKVIEIESCTLFK